MSSDKSQSANAKAIIERELNLMLMSTVSCSSCVVVINQQQEQNISHQQQCQDEPAKASKTTGKKCTVVKDGRVVVISEQPQLKAASESENT